MTVTVVNKYKEPNHIYCGRGSPVGNPYLISKHLDRDTVCDLYEKWFNKEMLKKYSTVTSFVNNLVALAHIQDINLGCFCAPRKCHCDTIKKYIDNQLERNNES